VFLVAKHLDEQGVVTIFEVTGRCEYNVHATITIIPQQALGASLCYSGRAVAQAGALKVVLGSLDSWAKSTCGWIHNSALSLRSGSWKLQTK
jgi:hypothetical protein